MEKCVFCGTNRKSSPQVRFFAVPREPGLKRIQWLFVLGDREIGPKDRICGLHFRSGRPSSDPSHEDFVPHLFLNRDPPEEVLNYLESLDDSEGGGEMGAAHAGGAESRAETVERDLKSGAGGTFGASSREKSSHYSIASSMLRAANKPSILQRKRKATTGSLFDSKDNASEEARLLRFEKAATKIHILHKSIAEAVGAKHGQRVIIKRMVPVPVRKQQQTTAAEFDNGEDSAATATAATNK